MKTSFTDEQIIRTLKGHENGKRAADIIRELGISEQTFYRWFKNLYEAKEIIEKWRIEHNSQGPHSSLSNLTPLEYAAMLANN